MRNCDVLYPCFVQFWRWSSLQGCLDEKKLTWVLQLLMNVRGRAPPRVQKCVRLLNFLTFMSSRQHFFSPTCLLAVRENVDHRKKLVIRMEVWKNAPLCAVVNLNSGKALKKQLSQGQTPWEETPSRTFPTSPRPRQHVFSPFERVLFEETSISDRSMNAPLCAVRCKLKQSVVKLDSNKKFNQRQAPWEETLSRTLETRRNACSPEGKVLENRDVDCTFGTSKMFDSYQGCRILTTSR